MGKKSKVVLNVSDVTNQSARMGKVGPILTSFHHAPVDVTSLENYSPSVAVTASWKGDTPGLDMHLTTESMMYSGTKDVTKKCPYTTYLAIRDKETGQTTLVETNSLVLTPQVTVPLTKNPTLNQEVQEKNTLSQRIEASKHLIKSFGQQKGNRFYEQQERMKIDSSQAQDRVEKAATTVDVSMLETGTVNDPNIGKESLVPPRNISASTADGVYNVDKILTGQEMDLLQEAANQVLNNYDSLAKLKEAQKDKLLSGLGVALFSKILESKLQDSKQAAVILYLEGIIKFSRLRIGELRKGVRSLQSFIPMSIRQKIVDCFSQVSGSDRVINPELEDKAKCYIIVLGLLAQSLSLDVSLLTESIWVRPDHLKKLVGLVGARMVADSQGQGQKIALKLPLVTFNMEMMRKRKR